MVSVVNNRPLHQSTGQQRETQKVGRELIEVRRVAIQRDTGWFFLLVRPKKLLSVRLHNNKVSKFPKGLALSHF